MHQRKTLGLFGIFGIWLTAGITFPLVNTLRMFETGQLMALRGLLTALLTFICLGGKLGKIDRGLILLRLVVPLATFGMFQSVRSLGASLTAVLFTATPIINFCFGLQAGRMVSGASIGALCLILGGVSLACKDATFSLVGFAWALFAMLNEAVVYELFAGKKTNPLQKCFAGSLGMGILGLVLSVRSSWERLLEPRLMLLLCILAFVGGFVYLLANMIAFEHLPTNEASVLAQGETPAVILGAYLILGERLSLLQLIGICIALVGAGYLTQWLAKTGQEKI
ncbi:MAG: EamA family transporter [bacterium]|nr:EamA family transporter [bacterium]